jgi:hypothetical protein
MVMHTCGYSTHEAEAGGALVSDQPGLHYTSPCWKPKQEPDIVIYTYNPSTRVLGQPELHSTKLCLNKKQLKFKSNFNMNKIKKKKKKE